MNNRSRCLSLMAIAAGTLVSLSPASAATVLWNGPGAGSNTWSLPANWNPGVPGVADNVSFTNIGAVSPAGTINNMVDASTAINSLWFGATAGTHTTLIAPDQTLTISGAMSGVANSPALQVGLEVYTVNNQLISATFTGAGGVLNINSPAAPIQVRQGFGSGTSTTLAVLDMSGLGTLNANIVRMQVGVESGTPRRVAGVVYLARTNRVTLTQALTANATLTSGSPSLYLGHNTQASGQPSAVYLGVTNAVFVNYVVIGRGNQVGNQLTFNPAFLPEGPVAFFRGSDGAGRVGLWTIGDNSAGSLTTPSSGTNDFTGGTVDAMIDYLFVGRGRDGNTVNTGIGTFTFNHGTVDVNTLRIGTMVDVSTATGASGVGTVNVNGTGTLVVNNVLELAHVNTTATPTPGAIAATAGTLNVNGGTVVAAAIIDGGGTSTVNFNGTTNVLASGSGGIGTITAPIDNFSISNSTLQLAAGNDARIIVTSLTTRGDTNIINVTKLPPISGYPTPPIPLIHYSAPIGGSGFNFGLGTLPAAIPAFEGYLVDNNGSVDLVITNGPPPSRSLVWNGAVNGNWDTNTANWLTNAASPPTTFSHGDFVLFDDTGLLGAVNLTTLLQPGALTVRNTNLTYTFVGSGRLGGDVGLVKEGPGTLVIDNSGTNTISGIIALNGGTLQVGNQDGNGSLGSGVVTNNAALVFARSDSLTVANPLAGTGTLLQTGTAVLTLSGNNSGYSGEITVRRGVLKAGSASALGSAVGATLLSSNTALDVNGFNLGAEPVTVAGAGPDGSGAIINGGAQQLNALRFVTLAGDTTFGGPGSYLAANNPGRWDIRAAGTPASASLSTGGQGFTLTKRGSNQVSLVSVTVDPALGDIHIAEGLLGFEANTTTMGEPLRTLRVDAGATLSFFNTTSIWAKQIMLTGNGSTPSITNWSGSNTIGGVIELNGDCVFGVAGTALVCMNNIIGTGNLVKQGASALTLGASHDFTGLTVVSNGTLYVDGTLFGGGGVRVDSGTLGGLGAVAPNTFVNAGGAVSPGNATNAVAGLEFDADLTIAGTNVMDLRKTGATFSSDLITCFGRINFGGTLRLNISGDALAAGDAFRLYNFSSARGAFSTITPAAPATGLVWDASTLAVDGTLRVALPQPRITSATLAGGSLVISVANGSAGASFTVLTSTNITTPLANWTMATNYTFGAGGTVSFTNAVDTSEPQRFFLLRMP